MLKPKYLASLAIAAALLAACGSAATSPAAAAPVAATAGGTINATLTDMKISVDKVAIPSGKVTFVVKNSGLVVHELVVLKTDVAQDKLIAGDEAGKVNETGNVGETGDVVAGGSNTFSAVLPAGHYVLICNEPDHYMGGMHMTFTVN